MNTSIEIRDIEANGLTFTCRVCGFENDGDTVIFLHGFPESSYMWKEILPLMAERGYRCFAPDQRGYSKKARPVGVNSYHIEHLKNDVVGLMDAVSAKKFHIVGHDWGCIVSWGVTACYQKRVLSSSNLSCYYKTEYAEMMRTSEEQRTMSQYIYNYMKPEAIDNLHGNDCAIMREKLAMLFPEQPDKQEIYMKNFCDRDAIECALNWYRSAFYFLVYPDQYQPWNFDFGNIYIPVLNIRGIDDAYQGHWGFDRQHKYLRGYYIF
jgi:pimeloyl-ACP methyl ester carboxylesterase